MDSLVARSGYPVSDLVDASYVIYLLCPVLAGFAAYGMRGWVTFHRSLRARRSELAVLVNAWWPLLWGGPVLVVVTVLVASWTWPPDAASWTVLLLDALTAMLCIVAGLAVGRVFPTAVAAPLVSVGVFVWIAYLPSTSSPVLHHLTPTLTGCCALSVEPSDVALRAQLTLVGGALVGLAVMTAARRLLGSSRSLHALVMALVLVSATGAASVVLATSDEQLTLTTVQARTAELSCADEAGIRVCLWPESASRTGQVGAAVADLNEALVPRGFPAVDATSSDEGADNMYVDVTPLAGPGEVTAAVARGYVNHVLDCGPRERAKVDARVAFLAVTAAGVSPEELRGEYAPEDIDEAIRQAGAAGAAARTWFFDADCRGRS
ncbi:DUF7224 domain-containing protein [Nocardioides jishulii]|uniref:DUF7224 domain-containing protein n=1 Tax=Nocardioides jishulii TaxID=2575440 RepID=A0A4U2YR76_9ACTN|nr:hypothetical protein [Nocardioides jishulii]QCX26327.1 hypothetical protein FCL41_01290 [Nocardioides jishulii]TKI63868.1 hypothetical protein FC770_01415 [Nocardioides jishulii]